MSDKPDPTALNHEQLNAAIIARILEVYGLDIRKPEHLALYQIENDRQLCPKYFHHFARRAYWHAYNEEMIDGWHIQARCSAVQSLWEGTLKTADGRSADTLVINEPPGCGKSRFVCCLAAAWLWLKRPSAGMWYSSFGQALCDRDANDTRRLISSAWFRNTFWPDIVLMDDQNQKRRFDNNKGGWRLSVSIESKIGFGEHPNWFCIDDPHDPIQGASKNQRQIAIDAWDEKFSTRGLIKGVKKLIVCQRLHEDDLTAHVLETETQVAHLRIPMEFESKNACTINMRWTDLNDPDGQGGFKVKETWTDPRKADGELMWPAGMDAEKVATLKRRLRRAHAIAGQLQQRPTAPEGDMFKKEWFDRRMNITEVPTDLPGAISFDLASATGAKNDYTAEARMLWTGQDLIVVSTEDFKLERKPRNERIFRSCFDFQERYPGMQVRLEQEGGAGGKDAAEILAEELSYDFNVKIDSPLGKPDDEDTTLRGWETWADMLSRGRVVFVEGPHLKRLIEQHLAAPNGRNDDLIDACAKAARALYKRGNKNRLRRPLLLLTPAEQEEFAAVQASKGRKVCDTCGGLGCRDCLKDDAPKSRAQETWDIAAANAEEFDERRGELGVRW